AYLHRALEIARAAVAPGRSEPVANLLDDAVGNIAYELGILYEDIRQPARALELHRQALQAHERAGNLRGQMNDHLDISNALTSDREVVALDYLNLGRTYLVLDLLPVARTALDAGLAVAVQNQLNSQARGLHWTLGQLDDREGRLQAAHDHYAAAAEIVEQVHSQLRTETSNGSFCRDLESIYPAFVSSAPTLKRSAGSMLPGERAQS